MYIIIVFKKHQIIQQYKKQPKKANKKIFFNDVVMRNRGHFNQLKTNANTFVLHNLKDL